MALDLLTVADVIHSGLRSHLELIPASGEPLAHPTATAAAPLDAFSSLALGEQRIARALYDAQMAGGTSDSSGSELRFLRRSLDDIARLMQGGAGWNRVFKQLKAEGVIAEQTPGHVVARWTGSGTDGCAQGDKSARTRALTHPPDFPGGLPGGNTDDLVAGSGEPARDACRAHP